MKINLHQILVVKNISTTYDSSRRLCYKWLDIKNEFNNSSIVWLCFSASMKTAAFSFQEREKSNSTFGNVLIFFTSVNLVNLK
jgi:hypothetical protein